MFTKITNSQIFRKSESWIFLQKGLGKLDRIEYCDTFLAVYSIFKFEPLTVQYLNPCTGDSSYTVSEISRSFSVSGNTFVSRQNLTECSF